ncbi:MAG: N-formylglutamate amidohydrolase [Acidobacteria bacterium]|nr:N-formylglutamate amidohydrolase [Acidobacteriota bacterium]
MKSESGADFALQAKSRNARPSSQFTPSFAAAWLKDASSLASIDCVIVTCEHASRRVPSRYRALFRGQETMLKTHRGSDLGALRLARELATTLEAPLFAGSISRLLIDLNRSLHHVKLYSAITGVCPESDRRRLAANYYLLYRNAVPGGVSTLVMYRIYDMLYRYITRAIDMEKLTLTALRQRLFQVADQVLKTGVPVAIERHGKTCS